VHTPIEPHSTSAPPPGRRAVRPQHCVPHQAPLTDESATRSPEHPPPRCLTRDSTQGRTYVAGTVPPTQQQVLPPSTHSHTYRQTGRHSVGQPGPATGKQQASKRQAAAHDEASRNRGRQGTHRTVLQHSPAANVSTHVSHCVCVCNMCPCQQSIRQQVTPDTPNIRYCRAYGQGDEQSQSIA
jgi:hypothetical protein